MKRITVALTLLLGFSALLQAREPRRPRILGIAGVTLLVSDVPASRSAYMRLLGPSYSCDFCEDAPTPNFQLNSGQIIALERAPTPEPANLLSEVFFSTEDLGELKRYLKSRKVPFEELKIGRQPARLRITDPDGHRLSFIQKLLADGEAADSAPRLHLIHAGFIVRDRNSMDRFYQEVLGFRPYWHGGMKEGETNWVSLQVPDGTDWIEYMLNLPPDPDRRLRGIMNHIAVGVMDIHKTREQLLKNGARLSEEPKIGRDGKWQLNLYDLDQTRVEFMEFTPVEKPCCSEYTGPHPRP
jgi:catechol 2,3-dioxygenase-like lactoylglutathione lyase family enzyme